MKAVMLSIQPKWCKKIASGEKTVEVRKTRPKIETPFKCFIYCTHNHRKDALHLYINSGYGRKEFGIVSHWRSGKDVVDVNPHLPAYRYNAYLAEGKVIGEFVCDAIISHCEMANADIAEYQGCIRREKLFEYANGKELFGWHISDLVIYDKPKELSEFKTKCNGVCADTKRHISCSGLYVDGFMCDGIKPITRPPQSWRYVEVQE